MGVASGGVPGKGVTVVSAGPLTGAKGRVSLPNERSTAGGGDKVVTVFACVVGMGCTTPEGYAGGRRGCVSDRVTGALAASTTVRSLVWSNVTCRVSLTGAGAGGARGGGIEGQGVDWGHDPRGARAAGASASSCGVSLVSSSGEIGMGTYFPSPSL